MSTRVRAERIPTSHGTRYWLDETCWAELPELERQLDERLAGADGWTPMPRLHRGLGSEQCLRLDDLMGLFQRSGLAVEGTAAAPLHTIRVAVAGSGVLARALAQALLRAGIRHLECLDAAPPDPLVWPASHHASGGAALAASLRPRQSVVVRPVPGVTELAERGVDIVLVASAAVECDRVLLDELVRHDLVHLVVGCHRDLSRIGPLVRPGRTGCVQCQDLARTTQDPAWPQVLAQLVNLPARPHPTLVQQAAARAVLEVGWLARGLEVEQGLAGRVELTDLHYPGPREVRFAQHPECGCAWLL